MVNSIALFIFKPQKLVCLSEILLNKTNYCKLPAHVNLNSTPMADAPRSAPLIFYPSSPKRTTASSHWLD
jgi:hypothetical protein